MLIAPEELLDRLDGRSLFSEERNLELFERVPGELRQVHYTPETLPDIVAFAGGIAIRSGSRSICARCLRRCGGSSPTPSGG